MNRVYWLRKRIHPTWQFTAYCLGVLIGVTGAQWWSGAANPLWLAVSVGFFVLCVWKTRRMLLILAFVAGGLLGLWRGSLDQTSLRVYQPMLGKHVVMTGIVGDDVETNKRGQLVIRLTHLSSGSYSLPGELWVTISDHASIKRGDLLTIDGKLSPGFGNYAGSVMNAQLIKDARTGDPALELRDKFGDHVRKAINEPSASLGMGYLLGQKRELPERLQEALKIAGLTHIVVASGYNLTILIRLGRKLFERVSKYLTALTGVSLIVGFIAVTGISPSMTRAGLVSALSLWAWYYGRKFHPITLLLFAGALTTLWQPSYAWGNLGWELSFAAFAGVMIIAPLAQAYFFGNEEPGFVAKLLGETVSAQVATAPIILAAFGTFSNIAVISNILILPFVPLAMLLTFVAGIGAMIVPSFAPVVGWPAQTLLGIMIRIVEWCADVPWAQGELQLGWWGIMGWYVLLAGVCFYMKYRTRFNLYAASLVE